MSKIEIKNAKDYDPAQFLALFYPGEAKGAWPNGSRVAKGVSEPDDATQAGVRGTVVASHGPMLDPGCGTEHYGFFIEWDDRPRLPVFVAACPGRLTLVES